MKLFTKLGFILGLLSVAMHSLGAADCINRNPDLVPTTPTNDFAFNDNGTVIHRKTGLMWMRCPLGYELEEDSSGDEICGLEGNREHSWQEALVAAQNADYGRYSDWRLPNRNELESIVELACFDPAINSGAFPPLNPPLIGSPYQLAFWSSSPVMSSANANEAWAVIFTTGRVQESLRSSPYHIRLVRDFVSN